MLSPARMKYRKQFKGKIHFRDKIFYFRCNKTNEEGTKCEECLDGYEVGEEGYCIDEESSCDIKKIPKNQLKLMDKLGIDLEDEEVGIYYNLRGKNNMKVKNLN